MLNIGPQELLLVLLVALIVVGPSRLPELGRTIGRALNEFRRMQDEVRDIVKFDLSADPVDPGRERADRVRGRAVEQAEPGGERGNPDRETEEPPEAPVARSE